MDKVPQLSKEELTDVIAGNVAQTGETGFSVARTALRGFDGSENSTQSRAKSGETSRTRGMPRSVRTFTPRSLVTRGRRQGLTLRPR